MFKKLITALIIAVLLITPFGALAAASPSASLTGPEKLIEGQQAEITFSFNGNGISAVSGALKFDSKKLEFVEASVDIAKDWALETNPDGDTVYFACADSKGKNPISKNTEVFTATFKVLSFGEGDTVTVTAADILASAGNGSLSVKDAVYSYTYGQENSTKQDSNTETEDDGEDYSSDYSGSENKSDSAAEEGPSHNNMLDSLIVKNAEISPEFDPEVKNYEATVPFEIEELEVEAKAADENATVTISDTELIYVGRNITKVVVLSESGLRRTYKIYTTRLAPEKDTSAGSTVNWLLIIIIIIAALIAVAAIVLLIVFRKKIFKGKK